MIGNRRVNTGLVASVAVLVVLGLAGCQKNPAKGAAPLAVSPASMARVATVDERYQSYNVEMLEVTGGRFWKPYKDIAQDASQDRRPGREPRPRAATRPPE